MSEKRDKVFEKVKHGPFEAKICLSKEGVFSCDYAGEAFSNVELRKVQAWAYVRLRETASLDWKPILTVSFDDEDDRVNNLKNCSNLGCYVERSYIAWDGKTWVETPWVVMPPGTCMVCGPQPSEMDQKDHPMDHDTLMERRITYARECYWLENDPHPNFPIIKEGCGAKYYYVPYTEVTWATMLSIIEKMRELRGRLNTLLASDQGWAQLATIAGAKLLPESTEEKL
jgi:hypothetical protein